MSKLTERKPRPRDDSYVRIMRSATQARQALGLPADAIDWQKLHDTVAAEYAQGRTAGEINWEKVVVDCVGQKLFDSVFGRVDKDPYPMLNSVGNALKGIPYQFNAEGELVPLQVNPKLVPLQDLLEDYLRWKYDAVPAQERVIKEPEEL